MVVDDAGWYRGFPRLCRTLFGTRILESAITPNIPAHGTTFPDIVFTMTPPHPPVSYLKENITAYPITCHDIYTMIT